MKIGKMTVDNKSLVLGMLAFAVLSALPATSATAGKVTSTISGFFKKKGNY